jgi:hypothetical protein
VTEKQAAIIATYSDLKIVKTRGVIQLVFEADLSNQEEVLSVMGGLPVFGKERYFAIAPLVETVIAQMKLRDEAKADQDKLKLENQDTEKPEQETTLRRQLKMSSRIALVCKEQLFHRFVEAQPGVAKPVGELQAAGYVRRYCDVGSRSEIKPGTDAAELAEQLLNEYAAWRAGWDAP